MNIHKSVKLVAIATLAAAFAAAPATAAGNPADAKEKKPKAGAGAEATRPQKQLEDGALAQFDTNRDGTISESEKAAAGERYKKVAEAMARRADGSQQHAERMAKRDGMKASKEEIKDAGTEARRESVAAMKTEKEATKEAVKNGEASKDDAKAAKKDRKKWWQFWKSGN